MESCASTECCFRKLPNLWYILIIISEQKKNKFRKFCDCNLKNGNILMQLKYFGNCFTIGYPGFPDQADHSLTIIWRHTNDRKFRIWSCHDQLGNHIWSRLWSAWDHTPVWPRLWSAWSHEWSWLWLTCYHKWTKLWLSWNHIWPVL